MEFSNVLSACLILSTPLKDFDTDNQAPAEYDC